MNFKWKFHAFIYCKMDGNVLYEEKFDTYEEAQAAIEENVEQFVDEDYHPTGHINKDYVLVD